MRIRAVCAVDQRLESGDLADEGRAGCAGTRLSARTLIAWLTNPISPLIAGTLADYVLEPAMREPSGLSMLRLVDRSGTRRGHGPADLLQLLRWNPAGWLAIYPPHPRRGRHPA